METPIKIIKASEYQDNVVRIVFNSFSLTGLGTEYLKTYDNQIAKYVNGRFIKKINRYWKLHRIMHKS